MYRLIVTRIIWSGLIELICRTKIDNEHMYRKKVGASLWVYVCNRECVKMRFNQWFIDIMFAMIHECNHIHLHHFFTQSIRHTCTFESNQLNSQSTPPFFTNQTFISNQWTASDVVRTNKHYFIKLSTFSIDGVSPVDKKSLCVKL